MQAKLVVVKGNTNHNDIDLELPMIVGRRSDADLVILQARDRIEAIRLRPARLYVIRRGKIISRTPPVIAQLDLAGETHQVSFQKLS